MDWNQSTMYEQRVRFILEVQQPTFSFAESCRRYGISRTADTRGGIVFSWRDSKDSMTDLTGRITARTLSRKPIVEHIVDLRQRYGWGSRKIRKAHS